MSILKHLSVYLYHKYVGNFCWGTVVYSDCAQFKNWILLAASCWQKFWSLKLSYLLRVPRESFCGSRKSPVNYWGFLDSNWIGKHGICCADLWWNLLFLFKTFTVYRCELMTWWYSLCFCQGLRKNFGRICFWNHSEDRIADRDGGCGVWSYFAPFPRQTRILCMEQIWSNTEAIPDPVHISAGIVKKVTMWHVFTFGTILKEQENTTEKTACTSALVLDKPFQRKQKAFHQTSRVCSHCKIEKLFGNWNYWHGPKMTRHSFATFHLSPVKRWQRL